MPQYFLQDGIHIPCTLGSGSGLHAPSVDESGCFPVVVNHHIAEGQPAYYAKHYLKLQGRKVVGTEVGQGGEAVFKTGMLGKLDLTREIRASLPGFGDGDWRKQDKVKCTDFDEATGKVIVVINASPSRRGDDIHCARRLCLADLPI